MSVTLLCGDSRAVLATLEPCSIDACVTDPPYELGFMGKSWDKSGIAFDPAFWEQVHRVLKPGAHLIACGGTRTYHAMATAIEDAGFEIRDCLAWLYGSGFPKSLNLGEGLGTALKPAYEPMVLARKPFKGSVRANVDQHGTGALNIDACRIEGLKPEMRAIDSDARNNPILHTRSATGTGEMSDIGRWPANVCLDDLAALVLDEQSGELTSGGTPEFWSADKFRHTYGTFKGGEAEDGIGASVGGASRFYYVAKPSREERDYGCDGLPRVSPLDVTGRKDGSAGSKHGRAGMTGQSRGNFHPTVKPVELMRWLVRLVTPINGVVLDPFLGSGTTGMACRYEQRRFIGIEREADYMAIAERRIAAVAPLFSTVEVSPAGDAVDPHASARSTSDGPRAGGSDLLSDLTGHGI